MSKESDAARLKERMKALPYDSELSEGLFPPGDIVEDFYDGPGKMQIFCERVPFETSPLTKFMWDEEGAVVGRHVRGGAAAESAARVLMLVTKSGSPDGIEVREYQEGQVYDLPLSLATVFLTQGWAREETI